MNHHPDLELVAGDDWLIPASGFTDDDGNTVLLQNSPELEYVFIAPDGDALEIEAQLEISGSTVNISVSAGVTANIDPGRYRDMLRIVTGTGTNTTIWSGAIDVDADAMILPEEAV